MKYCYLLLLSCLLQFTGNVISHAETLSAPGADTRQSEVSRTLAETLQRVSFTIYDDEGDYRQASSTGVLIDKNHMLVELNTLKPNETIGRLWTQHGTFVQEFFIQVGDHFITEDEWDRLRHALKTNMIHVVLLLTLPVTEHTKAVPVVGVHKNDALTLQRSVSKASIAGVINKDDELQIFQHTSTEGLVRVKYVESFVEDADCSFLVFQTSFQQQYAVGTPLFVQFSQANALGFPANQDVFIGFKYGPDQFIGFTDSIVESLREIAPQATIYR